MITKSELGRRIREARQAAGMTLKELDRQSGFSATHISEIERGKTSPTIGALIRIAQALGREPSYFIEAEVLPDIAFVAAGSREQGRLGHAETEALTPGIPGGRLAARLVRLVPGGPPLRLAPHGGCEGGYVVSGSLDLTVGDETYRLVPGDTLFHQLEEPRVLLATGEGPVELLVFSTAPLAAEG